MPELTFTSSIDTATAATSGGVTAADAAAYTVVVTDGVGTATSQPAVLTVTPPDPVLWQQFTEFSTEQSPARTVHDGAGKVYLPWSVQDRNPDMANGQFVGALARFDEATGALDPGFRLDPRIRRASHLVIQPDGKRIRLTAVKDPAELKWGEVGADIPAVMRIGDVDVLETSYTEEAGIKSTTFRVSAPYAYGTLSVEQGTHRLVRISPFDSQSRRHTSFAGVEVVPVVEQSDHIEIDEKDIRVDVYRSSGPGGQGVNTTDSAVRLTHISTGIVVSCQNERSQIQNKATAMAVLQSKLLERRRQEEQAKINALKGDNSGSWGNQMRSYVLAPYQMVKDLRTDYETGNTSAVLNGEIDEFIEAGIRWRRSS